MPDDAMDLDPTGVEAAARAISSVRYTAARQRANGQFVDEQDEFTRMALAAARHLRAVPESDELVRLQATVREAADLLASVVAGGTTRGGTSKRLRRVLDLLDGISSPDEAAGGE